MADGSVSATSVINAPAEAIFGVLADPAGHAAIDCTGWVREAFDSKPLTAAGQTFRMSTYHPNHPDGSYQMANRVQVFDAPRAISWQPGYDASDGTPAFGGWSRRYDLTPTGPSSTTVTLSYDWSAVPGALRESTSDSRRCLRSIWRIRSRSSPSWLFHDPAHPTARGRTCPRREWPRRVTPSSSNCVTKHS
ncbi:MAG TPA: hypothetical protein VJ851_11540 [Jatrophihabitans sp.]|nr:hypothetical protein [Jatrophihabitans sp.]